MSDCTCEPMVNVSTARLKSIIEKFYGDLRAAWPAITGEMDRRNALIEKAREERQREHAEAVEAYERDLTAWESRWFFRGPEPLYPRSPHPIFTMPSLGHYNLLERAGRLHRLSQIAEGETVTLRCSDAMFLVDCEDGSEWERVKAQWLPAAEAAA